MPLIPPYDEDELRRRNSRGVLEDGESIGFNVMLLCDGNTVADRTANDHAVRDAIRAARTGDLSHAVVAQLRQHDEAAYQRSKTALNDWRKDTAKSAETVSAIRDARWL